MCGEDQVTVKDARVAQMRCEGGAGHRGQHGGVFELGVVTSAINFSTGGVRNPEGARGMIGLTVPTHIPTVRLSGECL